MINIGFTGTRRGMSASQLLVMEDIFRTIIMARNAYRQPVNLHHGNCIGADKEAARLAEQAGMNAIPHDPVLWSAKYLLKRDREIVEAVLSMYATPGGFDNIPRGSGTWYTIRYSVKMNVPITIIYPDGSREKR